MSPTVDRIILRPWIVVTAVTLGAIGCVFASGSNDGDPCQYGQEPGICRGYSSCRPLIEESGLVKICGYTAQQAIVCCPVDYEQRLQQLNGLDSRISEKKCREYSRQLSGNMLVGTLGFGSSLVKVKPRIQCPTDQTLIVGGTLAREGEFPHMARLGVPSEDGGEMQFLCGGTLISDQWVMTAAHCLISANILVRLGELKEGDTEYGDPIDEWVVQIFKYPTYKRRIAYDDIALLKLQNPVSFSRRVRPACLYTSSEIPRSKAIAIGFGSTQAYGKASKELQKVSLDLFSTPACAVFFRNSLHQIPQGLRDTHLCAGYLAGGRDTCEGDSGGPLQIYSTDSACSVQVIGITSFGVPCGSTTPAIYTRVSEYIDWIEGIVWPTESVATRRSLN